MSDVPVPHRPAREGAPEGGPGSVTAVVLAGGDAGDALARSVGAPAKALVPLKGRPLGAYVLDALRAAQSVRRIVWVGAADAAMRRLVSCRVPGGARLVDSLALGIGAALPDLGEDERVLVVTADVPWLRGPSVDRFVREAGRDHDLVYPVIGREACESAFPGMRRTWIRLAEGEVTGGNVLLGRPKALVAALPWVDRVTRARKEPWRLAAMVGPDVVVRLASRRASLPYLEGRVRDLLGVEVRALRSDDASLGTDVDRLEHLPRTLDLTDLATEGTPPA